MAIRVTLNSPGIRSMLCSQGVKNLVDSKSREITGKVSGCASDSFLGDYGGGRWIGVVRTATKEARESEARSLTLTRAVGR